MSRNADAPTGWHRGGVKEQGADENQGQHSTAPESAVKPARPTSGNAPKTADIVARLKQAASGADL